MSGWHRRFEGRVLVLGCAAFLMAVAPLQASRTDGTPAAVADLDQQASAPSGSAYLRGLLDRWRDQLAKDQADAAEQKRIYAAHLEQHPDSPIDPSLREANQAVGRVSAAWQVIEDLERGLGQLERAAAGPSPAGAPSGTAELAALEAEQALLIDLLSAWQKRKADSAERAARLKAEYAAHVRANPGSMIDRTGAEANQAVGEAEIADRLLVQISGRVAGLTGQVAKARQVLESPPPPIETQPPRPGTPPGEVPPLNPQPPRPPTTGGGAQGGPPASPTAPASPQPTGPRAFGVTASDIWEGEVTERGVQLTRKEAAVTGTRKSYESSAIVPYKAAVTGRFTATLSRESYRTAADIRARYAPYVGTRGYTEVRPIAFDGFQGFALVRPAAAAATACWMGGPACATAGAEIQGAAIRDGVAVDVAGVLNGSSSCPTEQADHTSFLLAQVNAGVSEVWAMIASLKVSAGAVRVTTTYTGPPLNSAKIPRVILTPPGLDRLNVGDTVAVRATVEDAEPGDAPFRFAWTGDHEGQGDTVTIRATKPGKYTLTVTATGSRGPVGMAALTYEVVDCRVEILRIKPVSGSLDLGATASFTAAIDPDRTNVVYRWHSDRNVTFSRLDDTNPSVEAVFPRPGTARIWVEVLEMREGRLASLCESAQMSIEVTRPRCDVSFNPPVVRPGQTSTATLRIVSELATLDVRWVLEGPAKLVTAAQDGRSVVVQADPDWIDGDPFPTVKALVRVPFHGDDVCDPEATLEVRLPGGAATAPPPTGCIWDAFTPDPRSFATQPGRVLPLRRDDLPAGAYTIWIGAAGPTGTLTPVAARAYGPYQLKGGSLYRALIVGRGSGREGAGPGAIELRWDEDPADLMAYERPGPARARIYARNEVAGTEWYAICAVPQGGAGPGGGAAAGKIAQAKAAWENGDVEGALAALAEARSLDPASEEARTLQADYQRRKTRIDSELARAREAARLGKLDDALAAAQNALQENPKHAVVVGFVRQVNQSKAEAAAGLAQVDRLMQSQDFQAAERALAPLKTSYPYYPPVMEMDRKLGEQRRTWDAAVNAALGEVRLTSERRDFREALELIAKIRRDMRLLPSHLDTLASLERHCSQMEGFKQRARDLFRSAEAKLKAFDYDGAVADLQEGFRVSNNLWNIYTDPTPQAANKLMQEAVAKQKRLAELVQQIRQAVGSEAAQTQAYIFERALTALDEAEGLKPGDRQLAEYRAALQAKLREKAARETAGKLRAEGQALQQQGKLREAVAKYTESLKYVPDPELERYIAQVETAATRQEEAARAEEAKRAAEAARAERERREEAARKAEEARKAAEAQRAAEAARAERERREQAAREAERKRQEAEKQAQANAPAPTPPSTPTTVKGNMWVRVGVERDEYKADPNNPWTRGCAWESGGQPGQVTVTTGAPGKGPYLSGSATWTEPPATLAPDAPVRMNLSLGMTSGANPGGHHLTAQCYFQGFGLEWNTGTASKLQQGTKDAVRVDQSTKPGAGDLLSGQIMPLGSNYARDGKIQLRCMVRAGCGSVSYRYIYEWRPNSGHAGDSTEPADVGARSREEPPGGGAAMPQTWLK